MTFLRPARRTERRGGRRGPAGVSSSGRECSLALGLLRRSRCVPCFRGSLAGTTSRHALPRKHAGSAKTACFGGESSLTLQRIRESMPPMAHISPYERLTICPSVELLRRVGSALANVYRESQVFGSPVQPGHSRAGIGDAIEI